MVDVRDFPRKPAPPLSDDLAERARRHADAIMTLLSPLPPAEQEAVKRLLDEKLGTKATPHAGVVLGTVVRLFSAKDEWRVPELKGAITGAGVDAQPKDIYNALGYLTRRGYIRRLGYGRYLVEGALLTSAEDFGAEPSRYDDG
jgi:hypothetical protein